MRRRQVSQHGYIHYIYCYIDYIDEAVLWASTGKNLWGLHNPKLGLNKGVSLRRHSSASFSYFWWNMLSNTPRKASTYTPEVTASCSTWHGWGPRPKSAQSSSGSYFLLVMPHLPHTKRKSSNSLSASSLIPVRSLAWPSASGRQKAWVRTFHRPLHHYWQPNAWGCWPLHLPWLDHLQQPVAWQWDRQVHCKSCQCNGETEQEGVVQQPADFQHQAPGLPGMRSQHAPVRQWIMDNLRKTGKPPGELSPPLLASHPRHYLAGQGHQYCCAGACWLSPVYTSCSVSAGCAGSATCIAWAIAASQKMYCMESWQQDTVPQADRHCVSRMSASAILNLQTLTQAAWEQIVDDRNAWRNAVRKGVRTSERGCWRTRYNTGRSVKSPWTPANPSLSAAPPVTETATGGLDLSATPDAAANKIDDQTHGAFPLSDKIDGCLL